MTDQLRAGRVADVGPSPNGAATDTATEMATNTATNSDAAPWLVQTFRAMGCSMSLTLLADDRAVAESALAAGRAEIERLEQCLSRFRPTSELSRLNRAGGESVLVGPTLGTVLAVALRAARRTGGLCAPTLLEALEAAGYGRDFAALHPPPGPDAWVAPDPDGTPADRSGGRPATAEPSARFGPTGRRALLRSPMPGRAGRPVREAWRRIRLASADDRVLVRRPPGLRLDLAGVAKGWTADRVADLLAAAGPCLVDAGGDLAARGAPADLGGWPVAVADPLRPDADVALVLLRDGGIATSGTDVRRWRRGDSEQHHLIDPRTGRPSRSDVLAATVIARTAADADAHAKAALLLGVRRGLAYLADKSLAGLLVRRDGRVFTTGAWSRRAIVP